MLFSRLSLAFVGLLVIAPALKFFKLFDGIGSATIFVCSLLFIFLFNKINYKNAHKFFLIIISLIFVHLLIFYGSYQLIYKYLFSFFGFFIFYYLAFNITNHIHNIEVDIICKTLIKILLLIFILMLIDFLFIDIDYVKSIFPYTEHSHFYLNTFFIFILLFIKFPLFTLLLYLLLLSFNPSLTAFPILFFMLIKTFRNINKLTILILLVVILIIPFLNYDFYLDRIINFERNRSSLTYLQGLQFIFDTLRYNPFGVGFQQMNCTSPHIVNYYTELINSYYSYDTYQCDDAGFVFSKFVFELGYAGLLISIIIAKKSLSSILFLYNNFDKLKTSINHYDLFKIMSIPIFIDFFVRGYGYFSFNIMIFIIGTIGISKYKFFKVNEKKIR